MSVQYDIELSGEADLAASELADAEFAPVIPLQRGLEPGQSFASSPRPVEVERFVCCDVEVARR